MTFRFDPLAPAVLADPYPFYASLRINDPIHWGAPGEPGAAGCWYLTRYSDVVAALKEPRLGREIWRVRPDRVAVASDEHTRLIHEMSKQWMLLRDPPAHTRLRSLVQRVFTPRQIERLTARMAAIVDALLAEVADRSQMEVLHDFALPLPVTVIAELLGVPAADQGLFMPWSRALAAVIEFEQNEQVQLAGSQAVAELADYLRTIIAKRRRQPQDDLISALITVEEEGRRPNEDELVGTITQLLFGGNEPVVHLIGNGLLALLRHPEQLALLRGQPDLIDGAIEEFMRYDSAVQMTFRYALEEFDFGGQTLRQGDLVAIVFGAANRDPHHFPEVERFDLLRTPNRYLSLGMGIHYCIGG
ncbi:MAG TPA: cytochrome P450, partial [Caldilineaceae bacterium]|nr:cytochrome P450 [Caldilineaceae bacterium]